MPLPFELYRAAGVVLTGVVLGLAIDLYSGFRAAWRPRGLASHLSDLLFVLVLMPVMLFCLYWTTLWSLRDYVFLGLGVGTALYFFLASPILGGMFAAIFRANRWVIHAMARGLQLLFRPLWWIFRWATGPLGRLVAAKSPPKPPAA